MKATKEQIEQLNELVKNGYGEALTAYAGDMKTYGYIVAMLSILGVAVGSRIVAYGSLKLAEIYVKGYKQNN